MLLSICYIFLCYHFPKRGKHSEADKGSGQLNDSIWATVLGVSKTFGITARQALYDISYTNAILYSKATPMYGDKPDDEDKPLFDETKDANNPDLFNDFENEEVVRV